MNILQKQAQRLSFTMGHILFLLVLSIVISSLGSTAFLCMQKKYELIQSEYTTIAVPVGRNLEKQSYEGTYLIEDGNYLYADGTKYISPASAESTAKESEYYVASDNRILLSAHIPGSTNLSSGTVDPMRYNFTLDQYCYQLSVMALRCTDVCETTTYQAMGYASYYAEFEIVDSVCRIDAYDLPPYEDTLCFESRMFTSEGAIPFEIGKTYLVRGRYWDYDIYAAKSDESEIIRKRDTSGALKSRDLLLDPEYPLVNSPDYPNWRMEEKRFADSNLKYYCPPDDCWPYYAEYTGEWEDFLETEDGLVWKDEIIPNFEQNHASVPVILTDNIDSIYYFNSGTATLLDGTLFMDSDYIDGSNVCLISASYATVNCLSVGDTISLDLYSTGYEQTDYPVLQCTGRTGLTIVRYPLTENVRIGVQKEFTIVGIYSAPEWEAGSQSFHADTIIIPKASIPNADNYSGTSVTLLNTVIIENGSIDAFEAHMAANDKAGAYLYFDQGYTDAAASVQTLIDNAERIMIVGISMFILSSLLFLLLFIRRTAPVIRTMRLLGVSAKKTWMECFTSLIGQVAIAVLIGNALAVVLYDRITQMVLSVSLELSYGSVALCGAVQFLLLFVAGIIWTRSVANRNLMQKR